MRLSCLLLMGLALFGIACHPFLPKSILKEYSSDTLAKYSYLITTMDSRHKDTGVATGFFIRKGDTLLLASAFHVFTGWSLNEAVHYSNVRPAYMDVWYRNADNQIRVQSFSLPQHPDSYYKALRTQVDFDTMHVSSFFKDGGIYTVDSMAATIDNAQNIPGDTLIAYGYPHISMEDMDNLSAGRMAMPTGYASREKKLARIYRANHRKSQVGIAYFFTSPPLHKGASGAPVFRIRTDSAGFKKVEFVGVQSGSSKDSTISMMVRFTEVHKVMQIYSKQ